MTYKDIAIDATSSVPPEYQSNQEIYYDLMNLLGEIKELHGNLVLDPEDQKGLMPPRTPKKVLEQIADNIAHDNIIFSAWEEQISDIMIRLPEDKKPVVDCDPPTHPYPVKVPWYRRCFFNPVGCR